MQELLKIEDLKTHFFTHDGTVKAVDGVSFHLFELADGATAAVRVPTRKGKTALILKASRTGAEIHIQVQGVFADWAILLRGIEVVSGIQGGSGKI